MRLFNLGKTTQMNSGYNLMRNKPLLRSFSLIRNIYHVPAFSARTLKTWFKLIASVRCKHFKSGKSYRPVQLTQWFPATAPGTTRVVYNCFFRKLVQQRRTNVQFSMQFEIKGRGLLQEAFRGDREWVVG